MLSPWPRRLHHISRAACLGVVLTIGAAPPSAERVGPGDSRSGYESPSYHTNSRALDTGRGSAADLAAVAARPPLGLPSLADPPTAPHISLGRRLFFDRRLSSNQTISCGMCHIPEQGFTHNELATPVGVEGASVRRNAPSLYNVAYAPTLFHDGREGSLGNQIWGPLLANNEMANGTRADVLRTVAETGDYAAAFADLYAEGLTETTLGAALAAYQRALLSAGSPFDRWLYGGVSDAVSPLAKRGFEVFVQSGCADCHTLHHNGALFSDYGFHDTGIGFFAAQPRRPPRIQVAPGVFVAPEIDVEVAPAADEGRFEVTGDPADRWRYRTPGLRNVALTEPYMHDGSIPTLADVVAYYDRGGNPHPGQDPRIRPLGLEVSDRDALVAFLESLTGSNVDELTADARSAAIGERAGASRP